jgi:hypothetical protein
MSGKHNNPSNKSAAKMKGGEQAKIQKDRYRVLIEDVADGFYEVDLKGNFKFFNNALCREAFNKIYRTGEGVVDINWEIIRKDGEKRHLEISANLITDDGGKPTGFRGIARDVTDKVIAQRALSESETCALELSKQRTKPPRGATLSGIFKIFAHTGICL